jgi:hypothetical protein
MSVKTSSAHRTKTINFSALTVFLNFGEDPHGDALDAK